LGLLVLLFFVLSQQFVAVFRDLPEIKHNLNIHLHALQAWMKNTFHVSLENQVKLVESFLTDKDLLRGKSIPSIQPLTNGLLNVVLVPLYAFFILLYRQVFIGFFHKLFPANSTQQKVDEIIENSLQVIRQYITGLIIQMFTVAFLTGLGLYIVGVKQFLFLGILAGILNLIPYIGIWTSLLVSILMALVGSPDLGIIIKVLVTFIVVQLIDGNILLPMIVGSKVRVNALATLLVILLGGTLAGVGGMFLALPTLAILKVVFDHVDSLKPYGYLIGDGSSESSDYLSTVTSFLKSIPEKIKPLLKKGGKK
jgi:predicted PurR-regulated permease PerM